MASNHRVRGQSPPAAPSCWVSVPGARDVANVQERFRLPYPAPVMWWMDIIDGGPAPKRGDLIQTNVGDRRERTWFVLRARRMKRAKHPRRYSVWAARWWELEPETRVKLYVSAQRNGGQAMFIFERYPAKRRKTFEEHMKREPLAER